VLILGVGRAAPPSHPPGVMTAAKIIEVLWNREPDDRLGWERPERGVVSDEEQALFWPRFHHGTLHLRPELRSFAPEPAQAPFASFLEPAATTFASPQAFRARMTGSRLRPRSDRLYSTLGGTSG
jgi:hypothetical protein